jgi:GNAT superfamily N-acetyltransferase
MNYKIEGPLWNTSVRCRPILLSLTEWFGIKEAVNSYLKQIDNQPTFIAITEAKDIGFLCVKQHNQFSAEIIVMGIYKEFHRKGIGHSLVNTAEKWLSRNKYEFLQVKTLSTSDPDENYANTRSFYSSMGFRPLEENIKIWDENNPCLILVKYIHN